MDRVTGYVFLSPSFCSRRAWVEALTSALRGLVAVAWAAQRRVAGAQ